MARPENFEPLLGLAAAPIAWRNDDWPEMGGKTTFEEIVDDMSAIGYTGTEIGNAYSRRPGELYPELQKRGLQVVNAWHSTDVLKSREDDEADFIKSADFLSAMGAPTIGVSEQGFSIQKDIDRSLADRHHYTAPQWDEVTDRLNRMGLLARKRELKLVYHHHMGTPIQTGEEIEQLMSMTDPDLVSLLWDSGHLDFAGEDPEEILREYPDRIGLLHFKDVRHARRDQAIREGHSFYQSITGGDKGVFTTPGDGDINWPPIFRAIKENDLKVWGVIEAEQDPKKADPHTYMQEGREYLLHNLAA